jgi:hypothetical protein
LSGTRYSELKKAPLTPLMAEQRDTMQVYFSTRQALFFRASNRASGAGILAHRTGSRPRVDSTFKGGETMEKSALSLVMT